MGAICSPFQWSCCSVAPGDAIRAGTFAGLRGQRRRGLGGPLDDAAVVSRCGAAGQAGEPRAFAAALRRTAAQPQMRAGGPLDASPILKPRTPMRTGAPILS